MAFTEKDVEKQKLAYQELKAKFSQLQELENELMKKNNLSPEDIKVDFNNLSEEQQKLVAEAKKEAEKLNNTAQTKAATASTAGRRKNAISG